MLIKENIGRYIRYIYSVGEDSITDYHLIYPEVKNYQARTFIYIFHTYM